MGSRDGVLLVDCQDCMFSGLQIAHTVKCEAALVLRRCRRCNITGCTLLDNENCGILLDDSRHILVSGCLIRDDRPNAGRSVAIRVAGGGDNMMHGNLVGGSIDGWSAPSEGNHHG